MSSTLNWRFLAVGAVVVMLAVMAVVAGVMYAQDADDQSRRSESNSYESQPWLDPRVVRQMPLVNAAEDIQELTRTAGLAGFTGIRLDNDKNAVVLYWKGELPPQMSTLVDELRANVPIHVVSSPYSLEEFEAESRRLVQLLTTNGVNVYEAGPTGDFSSIRLKINIDDDRTDAQKIEVARQTIRSNFPLEFKVGGKATPF